MKRILLRVSLSLLALLFISVSGCQWSQSGSISGSAPIFVKIYVTNQDDDTVSVIDGETETVTTTIGVGDGPAGIDANIDSKKLYVANYNAGTVTVIDGTADSVLTTIDLGGVGNDPQMVGVNPATNKIYVAYEYTPTDEVKVINGATDAVANTYLSQTYPIGIGANVNTNKIYIVCWGDSSVDVLNGTTDAFLTNIPSVDSDEKGGIAVNSVTNRIYVPDMSSVVAVIDGATDTVMTTVPVGADPIAAAVNMDTNRIYVTNNLGNSVSVIDGVSNTVLTTIPVGNAPLGIAVSHSKNKVYVVNRTAGTVSVIDGSTNTVTNTIAVGANPFYVSVLEYQE